MSKVRDGDASDSPTGVERRGLLGAHAAGQEGEAHTPHKKREKTFYERLNEELTEQGKEKGDMALEEMIPGDKITGGAERHLWGNDHDDNTGWEMHWNTLRNFFPQFLRMREEEDQVTDVYCDLLGPRSHSVKMFDDVAFGLGRDVNGDGEMVKSTEAYRMDEMQKLILPQWEYRRPGTQLDGMVPDPKDDEEGTVPDKEEGQQGNVNGKFEPLTALLELNKIPGSYWAERESLVQGDSDEKGGEVVHPYLFPHVHYQENYSHENFVKARYLKTPRLLADKWYDRPLEPGSTDEAKMTKRELEDKGLTESCQESGVACPKDSEDAHPTMKSRVYAVNYICSQLKAGVVGKLWEERKDKPEALPYIEGIPALDRTQDKYEIATWCWLHSRIFQEELEISRIALKLIINIIVQMLTAVALWGIGFAEIDGGRLDVVLVSFVTGIVGIISGVVGVTGLISKNEELLRRFWVMQLWLISVLVSFLYTNAKYANDTGFQCGGTNTGGSPNNADGCKEQTSRINAAIALSVVELVLGWVSVYECTAMLDGINDQSSLEDNIEFFKYLQYYLNELLRRCQIKFSLGQRARAASAAVHDSVDTYLGPVVGMHVSETKREEEEESVSSFLHSVKRTFETYTMTSDEVLPTEVERGYYTQEDFSRFHADTLEDGVVAGWKRASQLAKHLWTGEEDAVAFGEVLVGMVLRLEGARSSDSTGCYVGQVTEVGSGMVRLTPVAVSVTAHTGENFPHTITQDGWKSFVVHHYLVRHDSVRFLKEVTLPSGGIILKDTTGRVTHLPKDDEWRQGIAWVQTDAAADRIGHQTLVAFGEVEPTGNFGVHGAIQLTERDAPGRE